jgi:hypothetical protein
MPQADPPTVAGTRRVPGDVLLVRGLIATLFTLLLALAALQWFRNDEIEHVHSAWYVLTGRLPYRDFFQHHHPLLWYVLAPLLLLLDETSATLLWIRGLYALLAAGLVLVTARLAREATGSRAIGRLAGLAVLSTSTFLSTSVVIRPDVPQTLLAAAALLFLLRALQSGRTRDALVSGVLLGLAFAFLQKVLPLLLVFGGALAVAALRRRRPVFLVLVLLLGFGLPCLALAAHLAAAGAWTAYLECNWAFNAAALAGFGRLGRAGRVFLPNLVFWSLAVWGLWRLVRDRAAPSGLRVAGAAGALLLATFLAARRIEHRYVLGTLPFLAVVVAWQLDAVLRRVGARSRAAILLLLAAGPLACGLLGLGRTNAMQRARIDFVLSRTPPGTPVHDGDAQFNLFREDLHYVWFGIVGPMRAVETLNAVTGGRFVGYDTRALVEERRPAVISRYGLDPAAFHGRYVATPFPDVYSLRVDH